MKDSMLFVSLLVIFWVIFISGCKASEHPGKAVEHPGKAVEHPGKAVTADFVKKSIRDHVEAQAELHRGIFMIRDEELNKNWRLKLVKIHDPVRMFEKDGQTIYFACSDFQSIDSDDVLDIDFWMVLDRDKLKVIDTKIHKLNGKPRFTYEGTEIKPIE